MRYTATNGVKRADNKTYNTINSTTMRFTKKSLKAILMSAAILATGIAPTEVVADNLTVKLL